MATDASHPLVGTTVSHYRVVDHLGGGGMGVVYLAEAELAPLFRDILDDLAVSRRQLEETSPGRVRAVGTEAKDMVAGMVVGLNVVDDEVYQSYRDEMAPILERYGGGFGYDFRVSEVLKSKTDAPINRVFTIYFPTNDSMHSFFANDEYREIRKKHFEKSVADTTIIATFER